MFGIQSLIDTDTYKLTMQQAVLEHYPDAQATYVFNNRGKTKFPDAFADTLRMQVGQMSQLHLSVDEGHFLQKMRFLKPWYVEYLRNYRFKPEEVTIGQDENGLKVSIAGPWASTILWEVPLMALICETKYAFEERTSEKLLQDFCLRTSTKRDNLFHSEVIHSDFSTRRRRSFEVQDKAVEILKTSPMFFGTSNPYLALKHGVSCQGTMAHEWIMAHSALCSLRHANRHALDAWTKTYRGDNGIALPDTFGSDIFFEDFDLFNSKLFDGVRHDSGDPKVFADKTIAHYEKMRIDPKSKLIVFSDSLNVDKAIDITNYCRGKIRSSCGIGTHFSNDFPGMSPALNIVIKLASLNGIPVVKLSDTPSKAIGDKDAIRVANWTFFNKPLDA